MIPLLLLAMAATGTPSEAPSARAAALLQDCDAHKFETVVNSIVDGKPHQSKVKLCGTKGQDDAAWVNTLKDAVAKVKANDKMPPEIRDQIASALDAEIIRLGTKGVSMALVADSAPSIAKPAPSTSIASLAPRTAPGAGSTSARPLADDYGSLPPLPAPKPVIAASAAVGSILPSLPAPRLTIQCATSADPKDLRECERLYTDSFLNVRADEAVADTSFRFLRRGDERAEVRLAKLQAGQSTRVALPQRVCQGVVTSKVEIEVVRHPKGPNSEGTVVDTLGPYDLRC